MVSINNDQKNKEPRTVADVVCPFCFKLLPYPAVYNETAGQDGHARRGYQGWCPSCDRSAIVIQYHHIFGYINGQPDEHWKIEKFKEFHYVPEPEWKIVDTPKPKQQPQVQATGLNIPIIIIGPGGDYNQSFHASQVDAITNQYDALIAKLGGILNLLHSAKSNTQNVQHD